VTCCDAPSVYQAALSASPKCPPAGDTVRLTHTMTWPDGQPVTLVDGWTVDVVITERSLVDPVTLSVAATVNDQSAGLVSVVLTPEQTGSLNPTDRTVWFSLRWTAHGPGGERITDGGGCCAEGPTFCLCPDPEREVTP